MSLSLKGDYDFDFQSDKSNRLIPFILAFLMYSVIIAITSGIFTFNLTKEWSDSLNGHITVEVQTAVDSSNSALTENQKSEILKILKETNGIRSAQQLQDSDILKILEPWLKGTAIPDDFPFPTIFDVETDRSVQINLLDLNARLSKITSGIKIHDHADWYAPILNISRGLFGFSIILAFFIFITVCITVVFITKKTLSVHKDIVRILQLIGARNGYIASQFKKYYFSIGCKSSIYAFICGGLTIAGLNWLVSGSVFSIDSIKYYAIALGITIFITMLIMFTSKNTVLFFLNKDEWID